ncbi:hypothetical protein V8E36_008254 [Tilletia maclaganii]
MQVDSASSYGTELSDAQDVPQEAPGLEFQAMYDANASGFYDEYEDYTDLPQVHESVLDAMPDVLSMMPSHIQLNHGGHYVDWADETWSTSGASSIDEEETNLLRDLPFLQGAQDQDFHPFSSRLIFLLHTIASNPRSPMSVQQIQLVLLLIRWLGYKETPSYGKYKRSVEEARDIMAGKKQRTTEVQGREGHHFVVASITHELGRGFANPEVRNTISLYPRLDDQIVDMMDGQWVHALRDDRAPPMIVLSDGSHAYVQEPVELDDYRMILVSACSRREVTFLIRDIIKNGPQLAERGYQTINGLRLKAKGRPIYSVFLKVFLDDLSGVRSKRWDVHHGLYFQNGNTSKDHLQRDASVKLFCASPAASAAEMMEIFLEHLEELRDGFECEDSTSGQTILVRPTLAMIVCDNPMASELSGVVGMTGNFACRACDAGGDAATKSTTEGMEKMLKAGSKRSAASIRRSLRKQLRLAAKGRSTASRKESRSTGAADNWTKAECDKLKEMHATSGQANGIMTPAVRAALDETSKDRPWAALLDYPDFDPAIQMPLELLHVVLLGLVKYLWRMTMLKLGPALKLQLSARLSDADIHGLGLDAKLRESLNGKDFRALSMVVPSIVPCLETDDEDESDAIDSLSKAWLAAARLVAALYVDSVPRNDTKRYQAYVDHCVADVNWTIAHLAPRLLVSKAKLHLLTHATSHFAAFGPLTSASAERFEAFNSVVRSAATHSNRLTPSRDIANRLLGQQDLRHLLGGGLLPDGSEAGVGLRLLLRTGVGKNIMSMYGLRSKKRTHQEGATTPSKHSEAHKAFLAQEDSAIQWQAAHGREPTEAERSLTYHDVSSVVLVGTADIIRRDHAVSISRPINRDKDGERWTTLALVDAIFETKQQGASRVLVRASPLWPQEQQDDDDALFRVAVGDACEDVLLALEDIIAAVNVQHDCREAGCRMKRAVKRTTQRRSHDGDDLAISHAEEGRYTVSFTQFRSSYTIWQHLRLAPEHTPMEIAAAIIQNETKRTKVKNKRKK